MIGTNNFGLDDDSPEAVVRGIRAIVKSLRTHRPECHVLVLDLFPRGEPGDKLRKNVEAANHLIGEVGKGDPMVSHLRIWDEFMNKKGILPPEIMPDKIHLSERGYEIWAKAMVPNPAGTARRVSKGGLRRAGGVGNFFPRKTAMSPSSLTSRHSAFGIHRSAFFHLSSPRLWEKIPSGEGASKTNSKGLLARGR